MSQTAIDLIFRIERKGVTAKLRALDDEKDVSREEKRLLYNEIKRLCHKMAFENNFELEREKDKPRLRALG